MGTTVRVWKGDAFDRDGFDSPGNPFAGFFSDSRAVAERFALAYADSLGATGGFVMECEVRIRNPAVIDCTGRHAADFQFARGRAAFEEALARVGCDGVVFLDTLDEGTVYVPLRADQVTVLAAHGVTTVATPAPCR